MSSPLSLLLPTGGVAVEPLAGQGASPTLSELAEAPAFECTFAQSLAQQAIPSTVETGVHAGTVFAPATLPRGMKEPVALEMRLALSSNALAGPKPAVEAWLAGDGGPIETASAENAQPSVTDADSPRETSGTPTGGFENLVPTTAEWLGWVVWPQVNFTWMEAPDGFTTQALPEGDAPSLVVVNRGGTDSISHAAGPESAAGDLASGACAQSTANSLSASVPQRGLSESVPRTGGVELPGFVPVRHEADQPVGLPSEGQFTQARRAARNNPSTDTELASEHPSTVLSVATEQKELLATGGVHSARPDWTGTNLASKNTESGGDFSAPSIANLSSVMAETAVAAEYSSLPDRTTMALPSVFQESKSSPAARIAHNESATSVRIGGQASADHEPRLAAMAHTSTVESIMEGSFLAPTTAAAGVLRPTSGPHVGNWFIGETNQYVTAAESLVETITRQAEQSFVSVRTNLGQAMSATNHRVEEGAEPRTAQGIDESAGLMADVELEHYRGPQVPTSHRRLSTQTETSSEVGPTRPMHEIEPPNLPGSGTRLLFGFGTESALPHIAEIAASERSQFTLARAEQAVSEPAVARNAEGKAARNILRPDRGSQLAEAIETAVTQSNPTILPGRVNSTLPTAASAEPQIRGGEIRLSPLELTRTVPSGISPISSVLPSLDSPQQPAPISNLREVVPVLTSSFITKHEASPSATTLPALSERSVREAMPATFAETSVSTPPFATSVNPTTTLGRNIGQTSEDLLLESDPELGMAEVGALLGRSLLDSMPPPENLDEASTLRTAPGLKLKFPTQPEALSQEVEFNGSDRILNEDESSRPLDVRPAHDAGNKTEPTRPPVNNTRESSTIETCARNVVPLSAGQALRSEETAIAQLAGSHYRPSVIQNGGRAEAHHTPKQEVTKVSQAAQSAAPSIPFLGTDQNPASVKQAAIPPSSKFDTDDLPRHSILDSAVRRTSTPESKAFSRSSLSEPEGTPIAAKLELSGTSPKQSTEGKSQQGVATFSDTPDLSTSSTASQKTFHQPTREMTASESAAFEPEFELSAERTITAKVPSIQLAGRTEAQAPREPIPSLEDSSHRSIETRISSAEFRLVRSWQGRARFTTAAALGVDASPKPSDGSPTFEAGPAKTALPTPPVATIRETVVTARLARPPEPEERASGDFEPRPKPAHSAKESGAPDRAVFEAEGEPHLLERGTDRAGVATLGKEHSLPVADSRHRRGGIPVAKADVMQAQPIEGTHRTESSAPRSTDAASNASEGGMDLRKDAPEGAASIARTVGLEGLAPWEIKAADRLEAVATKSPIAKSGSARTVPELAGEIALHAGQVRDLKLDSMMVVLRADSDTQIAVQLVRVADVIEVKARIERGDLPGLTNRWSELQQSLAAQGIRLHDFESKPRQTTHFEQNTSNSNAQDEAGRQPREQARRQAGGETSAEPMPARRTSSNRTIKSGTRAGTWELWA